MVRGELNEELDDVLALRGNGVVQRGRDGHFLEEDEEEDEEEEEERGGRGGRIREREA